MKALVGADCCRNHHRLLGSRLGEWRDDGVQSLNSDISFLRDKIKGDISSLKGYISSSEARLTEKIRLAEIRPDKRLDEVRTDLQADLLADLPGVGAELEDNIKAMGDKPNRVLENLLASIA